MRLPVNSVSVNVQMITNRILIQEEHKNEDIRVALPLPPEYREIEERKDILDYERKTGELFPVRHFCIESVIAHLIIIVPLLSCIGLQIYYVFLIIILGVFIDQTVETIF